MNGAGPTCCVPARSGEAPSGPASVASASRSRRPVAVRWCAIPAGAFRMGSDAPGGFPADGEGPVRTVEMEAFAISAYAVTNAQFADFVRETGFTTEAEREGWSYVFHHAVEDGVRRRIAVRPPGTPWWVPVPGAYWAQPEGAGSTALDRARHPVVHVSWNDARAYCAWSETRLPSEAEWEYAARGGLDGALYPWGDELTPGGRHLCNIWQGRFPVLDTAEDGYAGTAPVDAFPPNGYGLHNVSGNVWEWCDGAMPPGDRRRTRGPDEPEAQPVRPLRGGSFLCHASYCNRYRVAARTANTPRTARPAMSASGSCATRRRMAEDRRLGRPVRALVSPGARSKERPRRPGIRRARRIFDRAGPGMSASGAESFQQSNGFFSATLAEADPEIARTIDLELGRQRDEIELIASENIVSRAVLEAQGSVLTNKYAEGYPGRRYYGGCQFVDMAETLAIQRACRLFSSRFANVQPNSGSQANQAVFMALMKPGDTFMGLDLACGGHLTHGAPVNMSGKWFNVVSYKVRPDDETIDMEEVARLAREHRPKVIVAGGSAYSRHWDFARFRAIADEVGAFFMVDIAHFAGLVAGGAHPSPFPHAHVATTTTHKTLRGPRGGMILTDDEDLAKKFNSAIFPGLQGGPLMHVIAAKAVAFGEALRPDFKLYAHAVVANARTLADTLASAGYKIVAGGTDNHLMLVDLRSRRITGKAAEAALGRAHLTCNKNGIPFDPEKPMVTSGIRLGTPAGTTRGFGQAEFRRVGEMIVAVLDGLSANGEAANADVEADVAERARDLTRRFPVYG